MTKSIFLYAPKIIFDLLFDALYFLPWWYSRGLAQVSGRAWTFIRDKERELALLVWLKNILKPLYDDYSWQNRVKSVILRIGQILLRSLILLFWMAVLIFGLALYLLLPILTIWEIVYQLI
jgi:hypothetical protein